MGISLIFLYALCCTYSSQLNRSVDREDISLNNILVILLFQEVST